LSVVCGVREVRMASKWAENDTLRKAWSDGGVVAT